MCDKDRCADVSQSHRSAPWLCCWTTTVAAQIKRKWLKGNTLVSWVFNAELKCYLVQSPSAVSTPPREKPRQTKGREDPWPSQGRPSDDPAETGNGKCNPWPLWRILLHSNSWLCPVTTSTGYRSYQGWGGILCCLGFCLLRNIRLKHTKASYTRIQRSVCCFLPIVPDAWLVQQGFYKPTAW